MAVTPNYIATHGSGGKLTAIAAAIAAGNSGNAAAIPSGAATGGGGGSGGPTLALDFTSALPAQVTFTRTGSRTAIVNGVVTTVASGAPAIESWNGQNFGLALEPASTNQLLQSNNFATTWSQTNLTATSAQPSPDGGSNGWDIAETTATGYHELKQDLAGVSTGVVMCLSMFVKAKSGSANIATSALLCNQFANTGARVTAMLDGSNMAMGFDTNAPGGAATTFNAVSAGSQPLANGWLRVWVTGTTTATGTKSMRLRTQSSTAAFPSENYAGVAANGYEVAFVQTEYGVSRPTSYKDTTTAAVSTSADSAIISGANLAFLDTTQGTFVIEHDVTSGVVLGSGANTIISGQALAAARGTAKTAFAWSGTTSDLVNNGGATTTGANPTFGSDLRLLATSGGQTCGHIKSLTYYPTRLTVAQMQALTAKTSTAQVGVPRAAADHAKLANAGLAVSGTTPSMSTDATRTIRVARSDLRVVLQNWYCNDTSGDVNTSAATVNIALIRVATNEVVQVKFSGVQSYAMASGLVKLESDVILPSAFPSLAAGGVFPDGDVFRLKNTITGAAGATFPVGTFAGETNTVAYSYDASVTTMSTVNSASAFSYTGTTPTVLVGANKTFCPVLVGTPVTGDVAAVFSTMDSIGEAVDATLVQTGTWIQKACAGLNLPLLIYALGGNSQTTTWKSANLQQWMGYTRILVDNMGTNSQGGIQRYGLGYSKARAAGIGYIVRPSLWQRGTSTDNFATNANQTAQLIYPSSNDLAFQSLAANGDIDLFYKTTATRDTGDKWISNGTANYYTLEGVHPTVPSDNLEAASLQTNLAAAVAALA